MLEALLLRAQMHAVLGDREARLADVDLALELAEPEGFISVFVEEGAPIAEALAILLDEGRLDGAAPAGALQAGRARAGMAHRILDASSQTQPAAVAGNEHCAGLVSSSLLAGEAVQPVEPLTERELDVLRLMAEGLTYREIAAKLLISVNTVRSHVKAAYGKLNVNNRTKAIEAATLLRLL